MTPQTTFANGVNPWTNARPSRVITRPDSDLVAVEEPAPKVKPTLLVIPVVGGAFLTRCGVKVLITERPRGNVAKRHEADNPQNTHIWRRTGRWGSYRSDTPYDLVQKVTGA